jgi:hypothetical protein
MKKKVGKIIFSLIFVLIGINLINFGFNQPCEVHPITQNIQGQVVTIENPAQMNKLLCLSSDKISLISILVGSAMVFPGVSGFYKNIVEKVH